MAPERICSSVDLPDPFGPISPMRSPSETGKATFRKSGVAPKLFEIFCALRIGGKSYSFLQDLLSRIAGELSFIPRLPAVRRCPRRAGLGEDAALGNGVEVNGNHSAGFGMAFGAQHDLDPVLAAVN